MGKCPVCERKLESMLCTGCGFDGSLDYENHPAFGKISISCDSISALRAEVKDRFCCKVCGSMRFFIDRNFTVYTCSACGWKQKAPELKPVERKKSDSEFDCWIEDIKNYLDKNTDQRLTVPLEGCGVLVAVKRPWERLDQVARWRGIKAVAAGNRHVLGLCADGTVVADGSTHKGMCKVQNWENMVKIAAGDDFSVGLRSDGNVVFTNRSPLTTMFKWFDICSICVNESNTVGLREDGTAIDTNFDSEEWVNIIGVAAGERHTVGMCENGTVVANGDNAQGQCETDDWSNITAVKAGAEHTLGLRSDGTVVACGSNSYQQCKTDDWNEISAIAAGKHHSVGLRTDGTVVACGCNENKQCDVGTWTKIVAVYATPGMTVGLRNDGTVLCTDPVFQLSDWQRIADVAASDEFVIGLQLTQQQYEEQRNG